MRNLQNLTSEQENVLKVDLKPGEQIVDLERNGYQIIQDKSRFCFGMDAVLLTGFANIKKMKKFWTWEQEPGLFRFCWKQRLLLLISAHLKFKRKVRIWQEEV